MNLRFEPGPARRATRWLGTAILVIAAVVFALGAGSSRPLETHESYVARATLEMHRRGDWILPTFNGTPRLQKPPLNYWLVGLINAIGPGRDHITEFEARLPSVLAALGIVALCFPIARRISRDASLGPILAAFSATSLGMWQYAHSARPEMVYAFNCTLMAACFLGALDAPADRRRALALCGWAAFALATLTKGPHIPALVLVGMALGTALATRKDRRRELRTVFTPLLGPALAIALAAPWFIAVQLRLRNAGDFWRGELFDRMERGGSVLSNLLNGEYLHEVPLLLLPWAVFLPGALLLLRRAEGVERRSAVVLWTTVGAALLGLAFSEGKRGYYALPLLPMLTALLALAAIDFHRRTLSDHSQRAIALWTARVFGLVLAAGGAFLLWAPRLGAAASPFELGLANVLAVIVSLAGLGALALAQRSLPRTLALLVLGSGSALASIGLAGTSWSSERIDRRRFAAELAAVAPRDREVVALSGGLDYLVYYLDRTIVRVTPEQLAVRTRAGAPPLVLARKDVLNRDLEGGRVLAEERTGGEDNPLFLLDGAGVRPRLDEPVRSDSAKSPQ